MTSRPRKKKIKHPTGRPREFKPREKPECWHEEQDVVVGPLAASHGLTKDYWFKLCRSCKDVEWLS